MSLRAFHSVAMMVLATAGITMAKSQYKRYFVVPCEDQIKIDSTATEDFRDDWGASDAAVGGFKAIVLDQITKDIARYDSSLIVLRHAYFCTDSGSISRTWLLGSNDQSTIHAPPGMDSTDALFFIANDISFSAPMVYKEGSSSMVTTFDGTRARTTFMNSSPKFVKDGITVTYRFGAIIPQDRSIAYTRRFQDNNKTPLVRLVTMANWTGATAEMIRHMQSEIKHLQYLAPRTNE